MHKYILSLIISLFCCTPLVYSNTVWEYVDKKLEKKKFERWSLSSWFYQKRQMELQDQWLYMNLDQSGITTEFYIDYAKSSFDKDTSNNLNDEEDGLSYEAAAYFGFLGLVGRSEQYGDIYEQEEGAFNLRLIGSSHQSTHLILTYGIRNFKEDELDRISQTFYGGEISLYLLPFLGFDGRYRYYNEEENEAGLQSLRSDRTQWGGFIELSFFRVFIYQFEENLKIKTLSTGDIKEQQIKGTAAGVRLYF